MSAARSIFVLAGGTGGHVYPALAVALALRERGYGPRWIGTATGLEARVVPAAGIPLHTLPMRGVRGKTVLRQLQALALLSLSVLWSLVLVLRYRPRLVIGMGGYASVPAAVAAWCCRRPLLLQEQNAIAGTANRFLARFARCVTTGFPGVLTGHQDVRYLGNPVRADVAAVAKAHPWRWQGERPLRVLVLGGSLGARPLNEVVPSAAARLGDRCEWWHQCGDAHLASVEASWTHVSGAARRVDAFIDDMAEAYAWADLVLCRAGALTIAELAVTGRPSLLVPLPHAIDDHQRVNAAFLVDAGGALLLPQSDLDVGLAEAVEGLLNRPPRLASMAAATLRQARPQATRAIADCAEELLR